MKLLRALMIMVGMIFSALSPPAFAQAERTYRVQLSIIDGGRVIGQPSITIRAGREGRISLAGVYGVTLTVGSTFDSSYPVSLTTSVSLPVDGQLVQVAMPSFRMRLDQQASAEIMNERTARNLRVEAVVSRSTQSSAADVRPCDVIAQDESASSTLLRKAYFQPADPNPKLCCSVPCGDRTLTCCGGCCSEGTCGASCCP